MYYRIEKDFLGEKEIPCDAYRGIHTERGKEFFFITGYRVNPLLINTDRMFRGYVDGITSNPEECRKHFEENPAIVSQLSFPLPVMRKQESF